MARRPCRHDGPRRCWKEGRAASCQLTTVQYCYDHGFAWLTDSSWVVCTYLSPVPNRAGLARQPMHIKVDARPHPPGSTCCMSLHAAAEMLGDPARKKGRSSMDLWRSNRAHTTQGAAVYCHCGLVYGARVARGCPCNVIRQPVSQGLWSTRGLGGIGRQARGPLIIILTAA